MPRDIRVGDKVRLLGWEGFCGGLPLFDHMKPEVVTESEAIELAASNGNVKLSNGYWWPSEKLKLLDAPRPSAWTKTSEGKPDVGVWVLGWWPMGADDSTPFLVVKLDADGEWRCESSIGDGLHECWDPECWQPLPAPPEVPR